MNHELLLSSLNPAQHKAATTTEGPLMIVAGPGTGKTHTLTARMVHLITNTDTKAENILCLTFTDAAAKEMTERLHRRLGNIGHKVHIATFHGFAEEVMNRYPEYFIALRGGKTVADNIDRALIYRDIMGKKWEYLKPFGDAEYYRFAVLGLISDLRREDYTPEKILENLPKWREELENSDENYYKRDSKYGKKGEMKKGVQEKIDKRIGKLQEFAEVWMLYEKLLNERQLYDFDQILSWFLEALRNNPELKTELQEQYHYVHADEYQDTNAVQNEILWHLTDFWASPNLCVVGDDDQAIYRFQGASVQNIMDFEARFPSSTRVNLSDNYRSATEILEGAYNMIEHNNERLDPNKKLTAAGKNKKYAAKVNIQKTVNSMEERQCIAEQILQWKSEGVDMRDMAVIMRSNREVREAVEALETLGIATESPISGNLLEMTVIQSLLSMMDFYENPHRDYAFCDILHEKHWQIQPLKLYKFTAEMRKKDRKIDAVITEIEGENSVINSDESEDLETEKPWTIAGVLQFFMDLQPECQHLSAYAIVRKILIQSGLSAFVIREGNMKRVVELKAIEAFLDFVKQQEGASIKDILKRIELHKDLREALPVRLPSRSDAVQIMTAHKSKGLEFQKVIVSGVNLGHWDQRRKRMQIWLPGEFQALHDADEDERRLLFVAMTRAKEELILTHPTQDMKGKIKLASGFLEESKIQKSTEDFTPSNATLAASIGATKPLIDRDETEYIRALCEKHVWSATSLNLYLEDKAEFFRRHLLKIPSEPSKHLYYGIAIHRALEVLLETVNNRGKVPELVEFLAAFETNLMLHPLTKEEKQESLELGQKTLTMYYKKHHKEFPGKYILEYDFRRHNVTVGGVKITGKVDMMQLIDTHTVDIVDYKSGRDKPIKPGDNHWRQLVFYDLLLRQSPLPYQSRAVGLWFIRPTDRGEFKRRMTSITAEDRAIVTAELQEAQQSLMALEFLE